MISILMCLHACMHVCMCVYIYILFLNKMSISMQSEVEAGWSLCGGLCVSDHCALGVRGQDAEKEMREVLNLQLPNM